jgi:hypothetical protein
MKFSGIVLAAVAVTLAATATNNAQANRPGMPTPTAPASEQIARYDDHCSVSSLRGTYTFAASGFNIVAGVAQPKAIVEVIEFNGDGTLSVPAATLSANGVIIRTVNGVGTYTVAADCSGTILFAGPAFDIFVSQNAGSIAMIQTNPNTVMQGTATRSARGFGR